MMPDPSLQRVHLQVAVQSRGPFRPGSENDAPIRSGEKIAANRRTCQALLCRILDPLQQLLGDKWPDAVQFGERSASSHQIRRALRPKKGTARLKARTRIPELSSPRRASISASTAFVGAAGCFTQLKHNH
jgi:hypothetical protein